MILIIEMCLHPQVQGLSVLMMEITGSAINDNVINGSISLDIPSSMLFCNSSSIPFWMSFAGFWLKSPATVSGKVPKTLPSDTSAYPP